MRKISADYIFPVHTEPLSNGVIILKDNGEIADLIDKDRIDYEIYDVENHAGVLCPGFVNTHCHLELSYLKNKIPEKTGLDDFILKVEEQKKVFIDGHSLQTSASMECIEAADEEMHRNGIVAVGDISNTDNTIAIKKNSKINYHNFIEIYGSNPDNAEKIFNKALTLFKQFRHNSETSIVPHAPYSLSAKLFEKINEFAIANSSIISIHHQESEEENKYFLNKSGKIAEMIEKLGTDISQFEATGGRPIEFLVKQLPNDNNIQLVHNTVSAEEDIKTGISNFSKLWWCLCTNANIFIENKLPDIPLFVRNKCRITIGTDSLASNRQLSVIEELKTISRNYPDIPLQVLIKWATLNGAEFLKIDNKFGSFEKGKRPGINLIEGVNLTNLKLGEGCRVKVI